jgi:hypothetical protein
VEETRGKELYCCDQAYQGGTKMRWILWDGRGEKECY